MKSIPVFLLILLVPSYLLSLLLNNRISSNLFISSTTYVIFLFLFGIFSGSLIYGLFAILILFVLFMALSVYFTLKNKNKLQNHYLYNLLLILFVVIFLAFINRNRYCWFIDEFTHWADIVKVMCNLNDFGTNSLSNSLFPNYPPGMALFQYLFEKIIILCNKTYADWGLYFSYQLFLYSVILSVFEYFKKPNSKIVFLLSITISIICLDGFSKSFYHPSLFNPFASILIDPFLSTLAACGFIHLIFGDRSNKNYHFNLWAICLMLVLSKDAGLLFAAMICVAYIIKEIKDNQYFTSIVIFLFMICPKLLWNFEVNTSDVESRFSEPIKIDAILDIFKGTAPAYRYETISNFFKALVSNKIDFNVFKTSYFLLGIVLLIAIFLLLLKLNKTRIFYIVILEYFIYIIGLLISYLFKFDEYEATGVVCITRYLDIEYMILIILTVFLIIYLSEINNSYLYINFSLVLVLITISYSKWTLENFIKGELPTVDWYDVDKIRSTSDSLSGFFSSGNKVYIVSEGGDGFYQWLTLRYNFKDIEFSNNSIQARDKNSDVYEYFAPGDWIDYLINNNYNFVYTARAWQQETDAFINHFIDDYGYLFSSGTPYDYSLYSVNKETRMLDHYFSAD